MITMWPEDLAAWFRFKEIVKMEEKVLSLGEYEIEDLLSLVLEEVEKYDKKKNARYKERF